MNKKNLAPIHRTDAFKRLEAAGSRHTLRIWSLATGDIVTFKNAKYMSHHRRGGTHTIRLMDSGQIRTFRDITLFNIDGHPIYI